MHNNYKILIPTNILIFYRKMYYIIKIIIKTFDDNFNYLSLFFFKYNEISKIV